ncbi:hypothetical protein CLV63_116142 [Murinocardiopsis flavida]|uniref:Uncharacterized protein n=1 Tax=Murinocardiopsis flavida TaxID=645275 RepID=A0A2P8D942_9ACTN|nr:hypothetical protein [Murinocardiopsis flavida]PSK93735.1 hypothetical protein CLV63_116142 [Murinocardiopsis flavida]
MADDGGTQVGGSDAGTEVAALLDAVPLFAPEGTAERGRISATTTAPGAAAPDRVVVDFGWRSSDARLDLEIATRRVIGDGGDPARQLRLLCAERDFMEARARGRADWSDPPRHGAADYSSTPIAIDGRPHTFTVLSSPGAWTACAHVPGGFAVRLFAPAPPAGLALRRITDTADLEPARGQG